MPSAGEGEGVGRREGGKVATEAFQKKTKKKTAWLGFDGTALMAELQLKHFAAALAGEKQVVKSTGVEW